MNKQVNNLLFNGRFKFGQVKGSSGFYDMSEITDKNCEFIDKIPTGAVKFLYHSGGIVLYTDKDKNIYVNTDINQSDILNQAVKFIIEHNPNSKVIEYQGGRIYSGGRSGGDNLAKILL